ncbi:MAG: putative baseplate assembly protein, partial [Methylobacter sp.]
DDVEDSNITGPRVYLQGINTNIRKNDAIYIDFADGDPAFYRANEILPDANADRTLVTFNSQPRPDFDFVNDFNLIHRLVLPASVPPANRFRLDQTLAGQFAVQANFLPQSVELTSLSANFIKPAAQASYSILGIFSPALGENLAQATANVKVTENRTEVYVLGIKANLFGHNFQLPDSGECLSSGNGDFESTLVARAEISASEGLRLLALDAEYQNITVGAWVAILPADQIPRFAKVTAITTMTLGGPQSAELSFFSTCPVSTTILDPERGTLVTISEPIKTKVTVLSLDSDWRDASALNTILRTTEIYIQSGKPELAEEPITSPVCGGTDDLIELDGFYDGLEAGRWVIVSGERDDLSGVRLSELAMLSSVTQDIEALPGESRHSYIKLAEKLAYCFKRDSVKIYGNVVKATHGETRLEVLGSGDGAKPLQTFELKQKPLTHVSAANASGLAGTLKLFVNNIEWHEVDSLAGLEANDRLFISQTDNEDNTSVTFGNGKQGARLPTGIENIRAEYRNGIGRAGNVKAEQISLLLTKPLGVKDVINPLRASGGADKETRDQARQHIPLAVKALDRLVSTQDYEDFSRIFAGIGKAFAVELSDGRFPLIHVTIAGAGDIPIDLNSDLFNNLRQALHDFGDPFQKIQLAVRELLMIVIEAKVAILPDYQWEAVVTKVRAALLDHFSFERRELGQDVILSEVISVMQSVQGVAYVDVNAFGGVPEKQALTESEIVELTTAGTLPADGRRFLTPDEIANEVRKIIRRIQQLTRDQIEALPASGELRIPERIVVNLPVQAKFIRPAQLAFLSPDVPETLILKQIR